MAEAIVKDDVTTVSPLTPLFNNLNINSSDVTIDDGGPNVTEFITDSSSGAFLNCFILQLQAVAPWNNPDNIVSAQTEDFVRRLKDTVIVPVLFLIGGSANVINMAVFYKQGLKERINVCLFALSLADMLYLLNSIILFGEQIHVQFTTGERYGPLLRFMTNHNLLGFYGFTWVSQIISSIIASERCFCILQPLRSQTVLRTSTTTIIIVVVNAVVVGMYFFVNARFRLTCAYDPASDSIIWIATTGDFYLQHQVFIDFLDVVVYGLGIPVIAIVVVAVTTAVTMVKLRQAARWRAGTSSRAGLSSRELGLTTMLVYNSVFFIVCVFPVALFRVVLMVMPEMSPGMRFHNLFFTCQWVVDVISYINATFNIAVYYTMGSRYRETLWQLLGRKNKTHKTSQLQDSTVTS